MAQDQELELAAVLATHAASVGGRLARHASHRKLAQDSGTLPSGGGGEGAHPTMATRAGCLYSATEDVENIFQVLGGGVGLQTCLHGRYCGPGCSGGGLVTQNWYDAPEDRLDQACYWHDKCYEKGSECDKCLCNQELVRVSKEIWDPASSEDGCPQYDVTAAAEGVTVYFEQDCTPLCTGGETAPPGEGTCTADIQYEANLQGGDLSGELSTVVVADWAECCALCASTADCYAWTYYQWESDNGTCDGPCCALKGPSGWEVEYAENTVSGTWPAPE